MDKFYNKILGEPDSLNKFFIIFDMPESNKQYIVSYGTILLLQFDYNIYFALDNYYRFKRLFQFIYGGTLEHLQTHIYNHMINNIATCNVTLDGLEVLLDMTEIYNIEKTWIQNNLDTPDFCYNFENKTLHGILLSNKITNLENGDYNIKLNNKNKLRRLYKKYFSKLMDIDNELCYKICDRVYRYNIPKVNVGLEIYYADALNTFNFIENLYSQILHINNSDWSELMYGYYRILFYSMIVQTNNCKLLLDINNKIEECIERNGCYLTFDYNVKRLHRFMQSKYVASLKSETSIHEILTYYNYYANDIELPISFLTNLIVNNDNPHIRAFSTKVLYVYSIKHPEIDVSIELMDKMVDLSIHIDSLHGLDDVLDRFNSQIHIISLLLSKNYISTQKTFYIVLFRQCTVTINWLISCINTMLLKQDGNILNIEYLDKKYALYKPYFKNMVYIMDYIALSVNTTEIYTNNRDLLYHLTKFVYGIFKNLYGKDSFVLKVNYNPNNINSNFWCLFKSYVLDKLPLEKILNTPGVIDIISQYYTDIKTCIEVYDVEYGTEYCKDYIDKLRDTDPLNLPDEFLDPILFTPIHDPVILPHSDTLVDRTMIMAHLIQDAHDPFNRQPLTLAELDEHNKKPEIIHRCNKFISQRDKYIIEHS
jgi:hypothetical protein